MARIIDTKIESQIIGQYYPFWKIAFVGVVVGSLYLLFTWLVQIFIIDPIFCSTSYNSLVCSDLVGVSGNIATIFLAIFGILIMVYFRMHQPLIIAVSSGFLLWGLSRWTDGLSFAEVMFWNVMLYAFAYVLFSWLARFTRTMPILIISILIIVITRILINL